MDPLASQGGGVLAGDFYVREYEGIGSLTAATRGGCAQLSIWAALRSKFAPRRRAPTERHAVVLDTARGALISEAWATSDAQSVQGGGSSESGSVRGGTAYDRARGAASNPARGAHGGAQEACAPGGSDAYGHLSEPELDPSSVLRTLLLRDVLGVSVMPPEVAGEGDDAQGRARLLLHTFFRDGKERSKLVPRTLLFAPAYDSDASGEEPPRLPGETVAGQQMVAAWHAAIDGALKANRERPRSLIVLVNPVGGKGRARTVWANVSEPVMAAAGINVEVHETQYAGHAEEMLKSLPAERLLSVDGVVVVGGDGIASEAINGIVANEEYQAALRKGADEAVAAYSSRPPASATATPARPGGVSTSGDGDGGGGGGGSGDENAAPHGGDGGDGGGTGGRGGRGDVTSCDGEVGAQSPGQGQTPSAAGVLHEHGHGEVGLAVRNVGVGGMVLSPPAFGSAFDQTATIGVTNVAAAELGGNSAEGVEASGDASVVSNSDEDSSGGAVTESGIAVPDAQTQAQGNAAGGGEKGNAPHTPERALHNILRKRLRVGIVPAGSTDAVACSTTGTRDPATATLWIALGARLPIDVAEVNDTKGGTAAVSGIVGSGAEKRHVVSLMAYGFYGDIIRRSEMMRFLGPARYDVMGALAFFLGRTYAARVSFLPPVEDPDADLAACRQDLDQPLCAAGEVLDSKAAEAMAQSVANKLEGVNRQRSLSLGQKLGRALKQLGSADTGETNSLPQSPDTSLPVSPVLSTPTEENCAANDGLPAGSASRPGSASRARAGSASKGSRRNSARRLPFSDGGKGGGGEGAGVPPGGATVTDGNGSTPGTNGDGFASTPAGAEARRRSTGAGGKWITIEGEFKVIGCAVLSCRCDQAPDGIAPYAQLCDGNMQLFLVRNCSRWQFLQHLAALAFGGNAFKFDFVELYRVSGVHIEPLSAVQPTVPGHKSSWNVDGEVAHGTFIASAKRGLVDVFARGPDLTHQRSR